MATSLSKIKNQIKKLQQQAASLQSTVIARIKREIAQHGLDIDDLFGTGSSAAAKKSRSAPLKKKAAGARKTGADKPAKFADDQGNTWHGVGKRPQWIHDALAAGRSLDEFLVGKKKDGAAAKKRAPKAGVKAGVKAAAKKTTKAVKAAAKKAPAAKKAAAAKKTPAKKAAKARAESPASAPTEAS